MFEQPVRAEIFDEEASPFEQPGSTFVNPIQEFSTYRIVPHPLTGLPVRMARPSTFGGHLSETATLDEWKIAMAVLGVAKTEDLYVLANSEPLPEEPIHLRQPGWWMEWARLGHEGMDAARAKHGAHLGSAIHAWTEQIELGLITMDDVPVKFRPHVAHFLRVHAESKLELNPDYVETLICETTIHQTKQTAGLCGRLDRLRDHPSGWLIVDDTKTGRQAPKGLDEIAIQLAVYANAEYHWDPVGQVWKPAPENIHKGVATITHVPIDQPDKAEIIPVDIEWGLKAAHVVAWVLGYRNRAKRKKDGLRLPVSVLGEITDYAATL
jgi:RecB family exonuclease